MIKPNKHRTTFRCLRVGMSVFQNDETLKIVKLKKREMTEKGLMYHFDVIGGNGSLMVRNLNQYSKALMEVF